ncbi:MAG: ribosomal protein S18-alanine N-acetyltransferase [Firmicutes bacterium]|nr:ribosomal protein S18-alanine N-acetyltransferase [Bacillota bacterium]
MKIREMQLDDLEQVMTIEEANFSVPWTETGFFTFLLREDTLFLVAEEGEKILGYCGVVTVQDEGDITNVAVEKNSQNQGIGKKLLEEMFQRTQKAGVCRLFLEVRAGNAAALHLYEKMGFVQMGIRKNYYEQPVEDGVVMMREKAPDTIV